MVIPEEEEEVSSNFSVCQDEVNTLRACFRWLSLRLLANVDGHILVSEDFEVIAIGQPSRGNPLDPPLRSRSQLRFGR